MNEGIVLRPPSNPAFNSYPHPTCGHPLPSDGRGTRRRIIPRPFENLFDWISQPVIRKIEIGQQLFPLLGERIKGEGERNQ
jgi:hypothetical protein